MLFTYPESKFLRPIKWLVKLKITNNLKNWNVDKLLIRKSEIGCRNNTFDRSAISCTTYFEHLN